MAKLTQKQVRAIESALAHLRRANRYLEAPTTVVARRASFASTTLHYTRPSGESLYEVNKDYGSDLTGLQAGIKALEDFLNGPTQEVS